MILTALYDFCFIILFLLSLPKLLYQRIAYGKYRKSLKMKLGFGFPKIKKEGRPLIWIHAVSVGEVKAAVSLSRLYKDHSAKPILLITTTTETGFAEAQRSIPFADHYAFLPLDLSWIIKPIVSRVSPDLLILVETEFWLNFLSAAKKIGAFTCLANGKISERSLSRFKKIPFFTQAVFSHLDMLCLQSVEYKQRFLQLGIPETKLAVTGNTKSDSQIPFLTAAEKESFKFKLGIKEGERAIVLGSTHAPEEKIIFDCLKALAGPFDCKILIVPRHPERFSEVATWLKKIGIPCSLYSENRPDESRKAKVILIDSMGLLRNCYQIADLAIVCGSYTDKVGGHNILEPCPYGIPVIFGPHMHSQPELRNLMLDHKAGLQVPLQDLHSQVKRLLENPADREWYGRNGLQLHANLQGAAQKTFQAIQGASNL